MEAIVIALITGLCTAIPSVIATLSSTRKNQELTNFKIDKLTEKVNIHNNLIDRMYKIENRVTLLEEANKGGK